MSNEHKPTAEIREKVEEYSGLGLPQKSICSLVGIGNTETLNRHYSNELLIGKSRANAAVVGKLYEKCMKGDTTSIIFWCKTQLGFKETNVVQHDAEFLGIHPKTRTREEIHAELRAAGIDPQKTALEE